MKDEKGQERCLECQQLHFYECKEPLFHGLLIQLWEAAKEWEEFWDNPSPIMRATTDHELKEVLDAIRTFRDQKVMG